MSTQLLFVLTSGFTAHTDGPINMCGTCNSNTIKTL